MNDTQNDGQDTPIPEDAQAGADPLRQQLEEVQKTADQYRDQFLRKAAEFENYRRRTESDFANLTKHASESLVASLVPVLDDFARSLRAGQASRDFESFFRGVELIQSKLLKVLEGQGLAAFDSVGQPFDVSLHDALLQIERPDLPPHTVVEEVERGYRFHDKVLRHAKVVVSSEGTTAGGETAEEPS